MIAIYGTPCGGTGYVASLLRSLGLDVGHERMGRDGFVCGWAAFGLRRLRPVGTRHAFRLLRHPLDTLETLPGYVDRAGADAPWSHTNPTAAALGWWVTLHEAHAHLPVIRLGSLVTSNRARRKSKPQRYPRPTWGDLFQLCPDLTDRALTILEHT